MAKREECKFDAEGFIEEFRSEAVPSYHTAPETKGAKKAGPAPPGDSNASEDSIQWIQHEETDPEIKYSAMDMTADEIGFIKEFIVKNNFRKARYVGRQVMIREKYRNKIKDILELLDEDANMATYIDNVLTEHFKKHYQTIMGIAKKCPAKF